MHSEEDSRHETHRRLGVQVREKNLGKNVGVPRVQKYVHGVEPERVVSCEKFVQPVQTNQRNKQQMKSSHLCVFLFYPA